MYDALEDVDNGDYRDWGGKSFFAHVHLQSKLPWISMRVSMDT